MAAYISRAPIDRAQIVPLLAGALELQPWLDQWHNEFNFALGASPASINRAFVDRMKAEYG